MRRLLLLVAPFALAACGGHFEVPVPVLATPIAAPPPPEPATIAIPVSISVARIASELATSFPVTDSLTRAQCAALGGVVCHQYMYRRDSLALWMVGDKFSLYTRLGFRARVGLPGVGGIASCGYDPEPMQRAVLRLSTGLYWRSDWRIGSRGTTLTPELRDRCEVTVLHVDATPLMRRLVDGQIRSLQRTLDSIIPAAANLRPAADSLWRTMQEPMALDSASTVWLAMSPEGVSLAPLAGADNGAALATVVYVTARPRVVLGERPAATPRPLPPLTLASPAAGFRVPVQIEVPFAALSQRATALLGGEVAGKGIAVQGITVWGVADTAAIRVDLQGRVNGSLYLLGRVGWDAESRSVLVTDLRYTIASRDAMSRIKATLGAGRIKGAIDEATGHGQLRVGEQLDSLRSQLTAQMNRSLAPGVTLAGAVSDVRIDGLYTTQTAFVLRVSLLGNARLDVR